MPGVKLLLLVEGSSTCSLCAFLADIYDEVAEELEKQGFHCKCLGGGRISHKSGTKKIHVYGYSVVRRGLEGKSRPLRVHSCRFCMKGKLGGGDWTQVLGRVYLKYLQATLSIYSSCINILKQQ